MRIVGFAQTMRLGTTAEEGYVLNIQLDNGTETTIPTDQATVLALTKLWAENRSLVKHSVGAASKKVLVPMASEEPSTFMPPPPVAEEDEVDEGEVFGGDAPIRPAHKVQVSTDEMGYPVVRDVPQKMDTESTAVMPIPRFLKTDDEDGQQV